MNLGQAIRFYIKKMTDEIGSGMKKLLLDQDTVLIKFLLDKILIFNLEKNFNIILILDLIFIFFILFILLFINFHILYTNTPKKAG